MATLPLCEIRIRREPRPAPRPRGSAGRRSFNPDWYTAYLEEIGWELRRAMGSARPCLGPVGLDILFCRPDARRGDLSNYVKAIEDAANGIVFADDFQIRELRARLKLRAGQALVWARFVSLEPVQDGLAT